MRPRSGMWGAYDTGEQIHSILDFYWQDCWLQLAPE